MSFQGASVLVTGGSRGIGREIALRFADEGASRVAIGYMRNDTAAEAVAGELRARIEELVLDLPEDHPVRRYAEEKMEMLDRLGYASSKANDGGREPRSRPGWSGLPSTAPVDEPLPHRR